MSLDNKPIHALNKNQQHSIFSPLENDKQIEDPESREGSSEGMRSELEARFKEEPRITKDNFIKRQQRQQIQYQQQQLFSISPSKERSFYNLVKAKQSEQDEKLIKGVRKSSEMILESAYANNQIENKHIQIIRSNMNIGDNYRNRNQSLPEISVPNRNVNFKHKPLNIFQNQLIQQKVAPLTLGSSQFREEKDNQNKELAFDRLHSNEKDEDDDEYEYPKEKNISQPQSITAQSQDTSNNSKYISQLQSESNQQINSSNGTAHPNKLEGYGIHLTHKRKVLGQRRPFQLKKVSVQTSSTCNLLETVIQQQIAMNSHQQNHSKPSNVLRIFDESSILEDTSTSTNYSGVNEKKYSPLTKLLSPVSKINNPIAYYLSQSSKKIDTDACKNNGILNCKSFSSTRNLEFKPQEDIAKKRIKKYFLGDTNATKEAVQMHCNGTSYCGSNSSGQGKLRTLKDIFCTRSLRALEITKESIIGKDNKRSSNNARVLGASQEFFNNSLSSDKK